MLRGKKKKLRHRTRPDKENRRPASFQSSIAFTGCLCYQQIWRRRVGKKVHGCKSLFVVSVCSGPLGFCVAPYNTSNSSCSVSHTLFPPLFFSASFTPISLSSTSWRIVVQCQPGHGMQRAFKWLQTWLWSRKPTWTLLFPFLKFSFVVFSKAEPIQHEASLFLFLQSNNSKCLNWTTAMVC